LIRHLPQFLNRIVLLLATLVLASCGGGGSDSPPLAPPTLTTVNVSWDANREAAVNDFGGGYKAYYSITQGFNINDAGVTEVDVPFTAPPSAPTNITLQLNSGRYYFRVVAYSALNPPGGSTSAPSAEYPFAVP
jgi:hypothetical protein